MYIYRNNLFNTSALICRGGRTSLHHAAYNGHLEMVECLTQACCVVNAADKKDRRALHFAAYMGYDKIVKLLIEKGADVDVKVMNNSITFHYSKVSEYFY